MNREFHYFGDLIEKKSNTMKKMRLLVLSTLLVGGVNAQNLNLDTWTNSTTATGWTSTLDGYEMLVPGEEPAVNEATGASGSAARLNPLDMNSLGAPVVLSIFGLGTDDNSDLTPDGIPYTNRIESIDYQVKFETAADAIAAVQVYMINGNDTIGEGGAMFDMAIANYTAQNFMITYDPAFDGVNPTTFSFTAVVFGEDPAATTANFYLDELVLHDVDNTSLNELDGDLWKVTTNSNEIVVTGVESGDVVVYNANGQIVGTSSVVNGIATVATNNASGMLIVQLTRGNESGIKKVIMIK